MVNNSKNIIAVITNSENYFGEVQQLLAKTNIELLRIGVSIRSIKQIRIHKPAGIILDIQQDELDGIEFCKRIKSDSELSQMFLLFYTRESAEYMEIATLNAGADDYIISPIRPRIFASRIQVLLKRAQQNSVNNDHLLVIDQQLTVDREQYIVLKSNEKITFPRKEFELLWLLATKPGRVFSRSELAHIIWREGNKMNGRTIDVHIRKIREKLGANRITTIKGVGYKWG